MMKLKKLIIFFVLFLMIVFLGTACISQPKNTLSQVSTIDALLAGVYQGKITLKQLVVMGNTGIGTFDCLDGEMIVLDGIVYQIKSDGKVYTPPINTKTPFAAVINFQPEHVMVSEENLDYFALKKMLNKISPRQNLFYAFKIKGTFQSMKTRSVPRQKKPFPPLAQVVKNQPVFNMKNVSGTIIGFRCPPFVKGINVPGYHLHFISNDFKQGGHILQFKMLKGAYIEADCSNEFFMVLPDSNNGFNTANLKIDRSKELHKVEQ